MTTLSHFSNSYSAHGMLFLPFLASLSLLAFLRPMYIFVGLVTHYSCCLGLMGFFAIYPVNSLWPSSLGSSVYWASTNGPQQSPTWERCWLQSFSVHHTIKIKKLIGHKTLQCINTVAWERCWLQSSSVHHTMKIKKLLGHKTLQCTNTTAFSRERWTRAN